MLTDPTRSETQNRKAKKKIIKKMKGLPTKKEEEKKDIPSAKFSIVTPPSKETVMVSSSSRYSSNS